MQPRLLKIAGSPTRIFTDGAMSFKRNIGGWAFVVAPILPTMQRPQAFRSGYVHKTTNNRMELMGIFEALRWALYSKRDNVIIVTDSRYAIQALTGNPNKQIANSELVRGMRTILPAFASLDFEWVKGHTGNKWNERADKLATSAVKRGLADIPDTRPADDPALAYGVEKLHI